LAQRYNIRYLESSAKNKTNLNEAFLSLTKEILEHKKLNASSTEGPVAEPLQVNIALGKSSNKDTSQQKPCC